MEPVTVFKVGRDREEAAFTPLHNRRMLWHGSRSTNFAGILSQGLRIAPPEAPVTGYVRRCYATIRTCVHSIAVPFSVTHHSSLLAALPSPQVHYLAIKLRTYWPAWLYVVHVLVMRSLRVLDVR